MNWYAYANNNPYKYTDPDGRSVKKSVLSAMAKDLRKEAKRLIKNAKARGRRAALKQEQKSLKETGESVSNLSEDRAKELVDTGKLKNMDGHHDPSVSSGQTLDDKIDIAQNPDNITFKEPDVHKAIHAENGGTQVPITASMLVVFATGLEWASYIPDPTILIEVPSVACATMNPCPEG